MKAHPVMALQQSFPIKVSESDMLHREISNKPFQIDALDGLRGFAALLVVLSHTSNVGMHLFPFLDFRGTGKTGVYLFFLLSAFLLSLPLLAKGPLLFSREVMGNYWKRRFLRIYPLYTAYLLAALASTLVLTHFFKTPHTGVPYSLYPDEFLRNFLLIDTKGVTWSIAVEFKFYLILPLLVFLFHLSGGVGVWASSGLFIVLAAAVTLFWPPSQWINNDVRLGFYLPVFLFGIYLAVLHRKANSREPGVETILKIGKLATPIALVALLYMTPAVHDILTGTRTEHSKFHRDFLFHSACWSLVLFQAIHGGGWISRFFNSLFLRSCGALSFSIYLFHMPIISILKRTSLHPTLCGWIVLGASLVISYFSFRFLERPMSRLQWTKSAHARSSSCQ